MDQLTRPDLGREYTDGQRILRVTTIDIANPVGREVRGLIRDKEQPKAMARDFSSTLEQFAEKWRPHD